MLKLIYKPKWDITGNETRIYISHMNIYLALKVFSWWKITRKYQYNDVDINEHIFLYVMIGQRRTSEYKMKYQNLDKNSARSISYGSQK